MRRTLSSVVRTSARVLTMPLTLLPALGRGTGVGDLLEGSLDQLDQIEERVEEVVEDGADLIDDVRGSHRRIWQDEAVDHAHIELRGVADPEGRPLRRATKRALEQLDGV